MEFMSAGHVHQMNRLLAGSTDIQVVAATLDRRYVLTYQLTDGPAGEPVHWTISLAPDGVIFTLDLDDSADVRFVGDWGRMIRASKANRDGVTIDPAVIVVGDPAVLTTIEPVMAAARTAATTDVDWPAAAFAGTPPDH